jgi:PPOX class probable F420-dependent enzyme
VDVELRRGQRLREADLMPGGNAGPEGPPAEVLDRFAGAPVARLARLSSHGPRIVPVTFAWHAGTAVWAVDDVKPKRAGELRRIRDLQADPRVALLVDHYEPDWSALWWVELAGTASTLEGQPAEQALDALADRYPAYLRSRPPGPVIAVQPERWTWWSAR